MQRLLPPWLNSSTFFFYLPFLSRRGRTKEGRVCQAGDCAASSGGAEYHAVDSPLCALKGQPCHTVLRFRQVCVQCCKLLEAEIPAPDCRISQAVVLVSSAFRTFRNCCCVILNSKNMSVKYTLSRSPLAHSPVHLVAT